MGTDTATFMQSFKHYTHRVIRPRRYFYAALFISWGGFLNGYACDLAM